MMIFHCLTQPCRQGFFYLIFITLTYLLQIDPSIIGGMIVNIADKYVDMSISTKIKKITSAMEANLD